VGTYLASNFNVSNGYAREGEAWEKSVFGKRMKCMVIAEIVNAWTGFSTHYYGDAENTKVTVVSNDDRLQLAYLLVFCSMF
jgi:hypothetical protein